MKKKLSVLFMLLLIAVITVPMIKSSAASKAKVTLEFTDGTKKTWKTGNKKIKLGKKKLAYVYFGSYPQTEVTGKKLTKAITGAKYDKNGVATVNGVKYKRISSADATYVDTYGDTEYYNWSGKSYAYFKYKPIKWRVLSYSKGKTLLLSEYGIDCQRYNEKYTDITWENCTLRGWLNNDFVSAAFSKNDKSLVKSSKIANKDNPVWGTEAGADTTDKVFLLSLDDIINTKYGFSSDRSELDIKRRTASTAYAKAMGAWTSSTYMTTNGEYASYWWLRSPGIRAINAAIVISSGLAFGDGYIVDHYDPAVRPALYLNLSSIIG